MKKLIPIVAVLLMAAMVTGCGDSQAEIERKAREEKIQKAREFNENFFKEHPAPVPSKGAGMPDFK